MNLNTQTASLVNHIYSRSVAGEPAPKVGDAATTLSWTDRHAATVVAVRELTGALWSFEVEVVDDLIEVTSGSTHDGSAVFSTRPDPDGYRRLFRKSKKTGEWVSGYRNAETGKFNKGAGGLIIGRRDHHVDPSF